MKRGVDLVFENAGWQKIADRRYRFTAARKQQIRQIGADMDAIRRRQAEAQQKLERLRTEADALRPMDKPVQVIKGPNPEWTALKEQRRKLQEELDAAVSLKHMTDNHPTVQGLKKNIQDLTEQMDRLPQEVVLQTIYGPGQVKDSLS
jgi:DNA repair exonuclease SbcCD ATPase subunit